jgi:hypothetical protein
LTRLRRYLPAGFALLAAVLCAAAVIHRQPAHGLWLTRYSDDNFKHEVAHGILDRTVYFDDSRPAHPVPEWLKNNSSARWTGYFEAPRDGEYILGTESDDGSWLYVDDKQIVDNGGVHGTKQSTATQHLKKGFHRLRVDYFQGTGGAVLRLQWRLPSGYNSVGVLPVSMLYPEIPPPVRFPDRILRLAPWLLLLLAAALARRDRLAEEWEGVRRGGLPRRRLLAGTLVLALALGGRLYDLDGASETCDEWAYVGAGRLYEANVAAGIFDADQWAANYEHPDAGKLFYGAAQFIFGDSRLTSNAAAAVLSALTVLLTFLVAVRLFGVTIATAAGVIQALLPTVIAHGKVAALDCPSTFFYTLAMWLLVRALHDPRDRTANFGWLVLTTGIAIGTKFSNGFLIPVTAVSVIAMQWQQFRTTRALTLPWTLVGYPLTAFITTLATWPWVWFDPFDHLHQTFTHWAPIASDLYFGVEGHPPASYFFVSFFCTTPVALFLPFFVGLAQVARRRPEQLLAPLPEGCSWGARGWWVFLIGWFLVPFAWTFVNWRMDGIRYVYNIFPAFSILTGAGMFVLGRWIEGRLSRGPQHSRAWMPATIGIFAVYLAAIDAWIHPFYLDYFNEVVGGPGTVFRHRMFETGWWGEGLNKTIPYLNAEAPKGASYRLKGLVNHTMEDLREDLHRVDSDDADFIVTTEIDPNTKPPAGYEVTKTVRAGGAPIVEVFRHLPKPPEVPKAAPKTAKLEP